jgi:hypothetical protein
MCIFLVVVCGTSDTAEEVSVVKHTADVTSWLGCSTSCSTQENEGIQFCWVSTLVWNLMIDFTNPLIAALLYSN